MLKVVRHGGDGWGKYSNRYSGKCRRKEKNPLVFWVVEVRETCEWMDKYRKMKTWWKLSTTMIIKCELCICTYYMWYIRWCVGSRFSRSFENRLKEMRVIRTVDQNLKDYMYNYKKRLNFLTSMYSTNFCFINMYIFL